MVLKIKFILYTFQKIFHQTLNLLLITEKGKLRYVLVKDFNRLVFSRTKRKGKKYYCMSWLQNFTTEEILSNLKKQCLLINGSQAVNYESGIINLQIIINKYPFFLKYMLTQSAF